MDSVDEHAAETYDVVVVGGGIAGLSGALTLGRARRSVLVVDAGEPRNAPASGVHGYLSRDGVAPAALLEAGRAEVCGYGVQVLDGRVDELASTGSGFTVGLEDGRRVGARRLLVTTGLVDELPDVAGVRERWGRDVLHCPYCHGWEVRDRPLGVLGTSSRAVHQALLFRQWTDDLTLFVHTALHGGRPGGRASGVPGDVHLDPTRGSDHLHRRGYILGGGRARIRGCGNGRYGRLLEGTRRGAHYLRGTLRQVRLSPDPLIKCSKNGPQSGRSCCGCLRNHVGRHEDEGTPPTQAGQRHAAMSFVQQTCSRRRTFLHPTAVIAWYMTTT